MIRQRSTTVAAAILSLSASGVAWGVEISGVQAASVEQPRIWSIFKDIQTGEIIGNAAVDAFLDTGASGILLSAGATEALSVPTDPGSNTGFIQPIQSPGPTGLFNVTFTDVGVAGGEEFFVSNAVNMFAGNFTAVSLPEEPDSYDSPVGEVRLQLRQQDMDYGLGVEAINIFGMQLMMGRVMVYNPRPTNELWFPDTFLYAPGTPATGNDADPGIPNTSHHVRLSYGTFNDYSMLTPSNAPPPTLAHNPFIGPSPTGDVGVHSNVPGITVSHQGQSVEGSWLLDTGASASFISEAQAAQLGIFVVRDIEGNAIGLEDAAHNAIADAISTVVGGIGGNALSIFGVKFDSLSIPTVEGDPVTFLDAPVFIQNISISKENGDTLTLDGVFGMNFTTASFAPDLSAMSGSPLNWMVFNEPGAMLGLDLIPEPGSAMLLIGALGAWAMHRRRAPIG